MSDRRTNNHCQNVDIYLDQLSGEKQMKVINFGGFLLEDLSRSRTGTCETIFDQICQLSRPLKSISRHLWYLLGNFPGFRPLSAALLMYLFSTFAYGLWQSWAKSIYWWRIWKSSNQSGLLSQKLANQNRRNNPASGTPLPVAADGFSRLPGTQAREGDGNIRR